MPLIQVDLDRDLYESSHPAISDAIHEAQIEALGIPADDRFQVFRTHGQGELKFDPGYNGVDRRALLLIQVTAVHMYPVAVKRKFFETLVAKLAPLGIRGEDVLVSLVENGFEDWYAGK
ncbi:tautomerase family protein [Sinomonas susongensis]|uniref:tautomerase family protein n=1 Tax=Sinomonas susongensis TaxID=1324851 RepID=UPI0011080FE5|nr:tautomerase family protein [Sinomonas susongensis]